MNEEVVPAVPKSEYRLPTGSSAPRLARATVSAAVGALDEDLAHEIVLLTSEVVTNAVRHARSDQLSDVILRIDADDETVRIEVLNAGPSFDPTMRSSPDGTGTKLGLFLVDSLSDAWGVDREGPRTRVWFELARR